MLIRLEQLVMFMLQGALHVSSAQRRINNGRLTQQAVMRRGKTVLWHATPASERFELGNSELHVPRTMASVPLLLVPPLMVRPEVYDLRPDHSLTRFLMAKGFDVFTLDFGVPTRGDRDKQLSDYVHNDLGRAVDEVLRLTAARSLGLVGYCMGGLFSLMYTATHDAKRIEGIAAIGSPVNFAKSPLLATSLRLGLLPIRGILATYGNIPGHLSSVAFRSLSLPNTPKRLLNLLTNMNEQRTVDAYVSVRQWLGNLVDCPGHACRELVEDIILDNALLHASLNLGDSPVDLRNVTCPVLAFGGRDDILAPPASIKAILSLIGSLDATYRTVDGGHVAIIDGRSAPEQVWEPISTWFLKRIAPSACPVAL